MFYINKNGCDKEMNKKIISICIVSMFLLIGLTTMGVVGEETVETKKNIPADKLNDIMGGPAIVMISAQAKSGSTYLPPWWYTIKIYRNGLPVRVGGGPFGFMIASVIQGDNYKITATYKGNFYGEWEGDLDFFNYVSITCT